MHGTGRLECPGCGGASFTANPDGSLVCDYCNAAYAAPGPACPECGQAYGPDARYCPTCGADLTHECRACGAPNPPTARRCTACGQDLDALEALFTRATIGAAGLLQKQREEASRLKAEQEAGSQARLEKMWAAEAERQRALAQARAERDRQERIMIIATAAVLGAFAVVALVVLAISLVR